MNKKDPNFEGFCSQVAYPFRLEKMLQNYYHIISQLPHDLGEEDRVNLDSLEPGVELEEEEDPPETSA